MKKYFFMILIFMTISCRQNREKTFSDSNKIIDGISSIKLGMTIKEFENEIKQNIILKPSPRNEIALATTVDKIKLANGVTLDSVFVEFYKNKLVLIQVKNDSLYNSLIETHNVTWTNDKASTVIQTIETNSRDITCEFLYQKEKNPKNVYVGIFYWDEFGLAAHNSRHD